MLFKAGMLLPKMSANAKEKLPAANPLMVTIVSGSFAEILRVKLLSIPQNMHAAMIPGCTEENPQVAFGLMERRILASVINPTAHQARRLINS